MSVRIAVVGSLNVDLVVQAPRHPLPGETIAGGPFSIVPGGKGANQAVAAARLGALVALVGCAGQDAFGDQMLARLSQDGVNATRVARVPGSTGIALITVASTGQNSIVIVSGANGRLSGDWVRASSDAIASADYLLLQLEIPLEPIQVAVEIAGKHGVPVILNPAPAQPLPRDLLSRIAYLVPNESELSILSGMEGGAPESHAEAVRRLHGMGAGNLVVTLGERGALVAAREARTVLVPPPEVEVVDTTAAGDAFVAALAVALAEGCDLVEATRWGCAAGALACSVFGAQPSLPSRAAVVKLLAGSRRPRRVPDT